MHEGLNPAPDVVANGTHLVDGLPFGIVEPPVFHPAQPNRSCQAHATAHRDRAIGLWGIASAEALAVVVGPLIEVPALVALVYMALWLKKKWYANKTAKADV